MVTFPYGKDVRNEIIYGGIYFVYKNEKLLYIGQSKNIGYRLNSYVRNQSHLTFSDATHVKVKRLDDANERKKLEAELILKYLPPMNYAGTKGKSKRCLSKPNKKPAQLSLDEEIYNKIKSIGADEERSFSQQVNKILKEYLKGKGSK